MAATTFSRLQQKRGPNFDLGVTQLDTSGDLTCRWVLVLRNAHDKKASVGHALQKSVEAVNAALAFLSEQLRPGSVDKLQNTFNAALSLSQAKGMYDGLIREHQLHKFYLNFQVSEPAPRTLLRRIRKSPKGGKNEELTDKRLYLYLEIERLDEKEGQPFPPASWGIDPRQIEPWQFALQKTPDVRTRTYILRSDGTDRDETCPTAFADEIGSDPDTFGKPLRQPRSRSLIPRGGICRFASSESV